IHEALTGQLPFLSGKTLTELCPEAPPALADVLNQCLKPNPNERPASAVEVYLRLQELGKASGILLLPPGAMDKLLSARTDQHQQSTVTYFSPKERRLKLWLALTGAALVLGVGAWALWMLALGR